MLLIRLFGFHLQWKAQSNGFIFRVHGSFTSFGRRGGFLLFVVNFAFRGSVQFAVIRILRFVGTTLCAEHLETSPIFVIHDVVATLDLNAFMTRGPAASFAGTVER